MEDKECHKFTTYSRSSRQEVRHVSGSSLRKLEKENDEPLLDGWVAYLRIITPEELEWEPRARIRGHEMDDARRDVGACLNGGRGRELVGVGPLGSYPPKVTPLSLHTRKTGCSLSPHPEQ